MGITITDVTVDNSDPMLGPQQITDVANFTAQGWLYRSGTSAERAALTTAELTAVRMWKDTDNGRHLYFRENGAWVKQDRIKSGISAGVTDGNGYMPLIAHGLGDTALSAIAIPTINTPTIASLIKVNTFIPNSTAIQVQVFRTDTGAPYTANIVNVYWIATR